MSQENNTQKKISYTALGLSIGLILGGIVGLIIDNMIIFAGGGLVLGLAIGSALDSRPWKMFLDRNVESRLTVKVICKIRPVNLQIGMRKMKKNRFVNIVLLFVLLTGCADRKSEVDVQKTSITSLVPYTSESLGIRSLVPEDWVQFFPAGTFVRAMPQSDPTFLIFGAIPGVTPEQIIASLIAQTGIQETPISTGNHIIDRFDWTLYSMEIQQGFTLTSNPDYGTLIADVALAESDGKVLAVATGSPVGERDVLYKTVFLPAVDAFEIFDGAENDDSVAVDIPERDYWPTDEWQTSTPEEQGMDGDKLDDMITFIKENQIPVHSVIVVRHGYIVLDEKFSSYQNSEKVASVTKSITSALIGIAIDKGYIGGVDQTVTSLFPDREFANQDTRKQVMTVEDLLTMRSGLDWPAGPCWWLEGAECADYTTQIMLEDEDSLQFILDQPMAEEPGMNFNYVAGASHLLSAIITEKTGMSALDFAQENLFQPLGIEVTVWPSDGEGLNLGYGDISMSPEDMARFGFLYLNEGQWDGKPIISAEWVRDSQQPHAVTINKIQPNYGYQWWVNPDLGFYNAAGAGGHYIIVLPEQDMVVVFTGNARGTLGQDQWWEGTPEELFRVYILPAVE